MRYITDTASSNVAKSVDSSLLGESVVGVSIKGHIIFAESQIVNNFSDGHDMSSHIGIFFQLFESYIASCYLIVIIIGCWSEIEVKELIKGIGQSRTQRYQIIEEPQIVYIDPLLVVLALPPLSQ